MSYFTLFTVFSGILIAHQGVQALTALERLQYQPLFQNFIQAHGRVYENKLEHEKRFNIFAQNMKKIETLQKEQKGTAVYGVTQFSDLTAEEFKERFSSLRSDDDEEDYYPLAEIPKVKRLPRNFDWRKKKVITPVKIQGSCGACWTFSTTGNVEALYAIKHKKLLSLSEQELLDCDLRDTGCHGGTMKKAYTALLKLGGFMLEKDYKYTAVDNNTCLFKKKKVAVKISGGVSFDTNESDWAKWLYKKGPISIGLNSVDMQFYFGGVSVPTKENCDPDGVDHGVLIVGFGVEKKIPYWIIKNSWGKTFGEKGYYRVHRGSNACGLATMGSSAVL